MNTTLLKPTLLAATVVALTAPCSAQTVIDNAFGYSGGGAAPGPVTASAGLLGGDIQTGTLGDGWETTVDLPLGAIYNLSAAMPGDGNFNISGGGVLGLAGQVSTRRVFTGTSLQAGEEYSFALSKANASLVGLLGAVNVQIGHTDGTTDTVLVDTETGTGLAGVVDLLGLFGSSDTATFQFDGKDFAGEDLYVELQADSLGGLLGETVQFNNMSITQVPEPATASLFMLGALALCRRRR